MAIRFEQMPAANQQKALEIFGQQMRGEITQAQAEAAARQNEKAAQQARASGTPSGGAVIAPTTPATTTTAAPTSGTTTTTTTTTAAAGNESVCGPRPTSSPGAGYEWRCDSNSKTWVRIKVGGEQPGNWQPGQNVGGPDRVLSNGGAVANGVYIPPGTFGPGANLVPVTPPATTPPAEEEKKTTNPFEDPTQKPAGAPQGYDYVWTGSRWELVKVGGDTAQENAQQRAEQRESAKAIINNLLAEYGLGSLTDFVNNLITQEDIISGDIILGRIRQTEQYRARFAGNQARRNAGFNALSEAQYIALENSYRQVMRASGLPAGFYDAPDDFNTLIGGDVSVAELSSRVNEGYLAVQQANPQVINEMRRLYGVDDSMLAAYFLDPAKATPMLLRQARAAQIASEATLQAQQEIGAMTAEELAVAGITQQQARQGFQTIAQAEELFVPLPGTTEQAISQEEQIAGVFGTSAAAQQRIRQRSRERQAAFQAGGQFARQGSTVTGLQ